jgi:hypothetical protein
MTSTRRSAAAVLFALASGSALADSLDINLHNDAMRATFAHAVNPGMEWDVGHLFNDDSDSITHVGMHVSGENWSRAGIFDIGLGGRALWVRNDVDDEAAIALGVRVRFSPVHRLGIGGEFYHAPDIIAFGDAESYTEVSLRLDYQILPKALVYVGYRNIEMDFAGLRDVELEDDFHLGMKLLW